MNHFNRLSHFTQERFWLRVKHFNRLPHPFKGGNTVKPASNGGNHEFSL